MSCWIFLLPIWLLIVDSVVSDACGQRHTLPMPLISHGRDASLGLWPWHVAVFQRIIQTEEKYACGGTIVSPTYILTAAHCTTNPRIMEPSEILIRAGISNLRHPEDSLQNKTVSQIITHEDYNKVTLENDIALLKLDGMLNFTDFVKPICLGKDQAEEELIVNKDGYVPGWGTNELGEMPDQQQYAKMLVVSRYTCKESDPDYYPKYLFDGRSFCAGYRNKTSPLQGDSGGGLYIEIKKRWILRGIVSHGKFNVVTQQLDWDEYIVFTDVAYFHPWISEAINDCGQRTASLSPENHENESHSGEWPWYAAVLSRRNDTIKYQCAGTIISPNHILTSAYKMFMYGTQRALKPSEIFIRTGSTTHRLKHSLQETAVSEILIHQEYLNPDFENNNDIALLKLVKKLFFTDVMKPVCLWRGRAEEKFIVGKVGHAPGWVFDENDNLLLNLKQFVVEIFSIKDCREFYKGNKVESKSICVKYLNGTKAISGYAGRGLLIEQNGRWFLRGIFRFGLLNSKQYMDPLNYQVFTDVAYFLLWIKLKTAVYNEETFQSV